MTPKIEEKPKRKYIVRFHDGNLTYIVAETFCRPSEHDPFYTFKLDGHVVAQYTATVVAGWQIENN